MIVLKFEWKRRWRQSLNLLCINLYVITCHPFVLKTKKKNDHFADDTPDFLSTAFHSVIAQWMRSSSFFSPLTITNPIIVRVFKNNSDPVRSIWIDLMWTAHAHFACNLSFDSVGHSPIDVRTTDHHLPFLFEERSTLSCSTIHPLPWPASGICNEKLVKSPAFTLANVAETEEIQNRLRLFRANREKTIFCLKLISCCKNWLKKLFVLTWFQFFWIYFILFFVSFGFWLPQLIQIDDETRGAAVAVAVGAVDFPPSTYGNR